MGMTVGVPFHDPATEGSRKLLLLPQPTSVRVPAASTRASPAWVK
jgi:hypothetical protein